MKQPSWTFYECPLILVAGGYKEKKQTGTEITSSTSKAKNLEDYSTINFHKFSYSKVIEAVSS